jgi:tetratricopeptide (TPR) repeat protein
MVINEMDISERAHDLIRVFGESSEDFSLDGLELEVYWLDSELRKNGNVKLAATLFQKFEEWVRKTERKTFEIKTRFEEYLCEARGRTTSSPSQGTGDADLSRSSTGVERSALDAMVSRIERLVFSGSRSIDLVMYTSVIVDRLRAGSSLVPELERLEATLVAFEEEHACDELRAILAHACELTDDAERHVEFLISRGRYLVATGRAVESISLFDRAVSISANNKSESMIYALAEKMACFRSIGRIEEAEGIFREMGAIVSREQAALRSGTDKVTT